MAKVFGYEQDYEEAAQATEAAEEFDSAKQEKFIKSLTPTASEAASAKASLLGLAQEAYRRCHTAKTAAALQQMVKNMYFTCSSTKALLTYGSVEEAVQEMCEVGMERMNKFNPELGSYSTFINRAFINYSNTKAKNSMRDARYWADSADASLPGTDDFTVWDCVECKDHSGDAQKIYTAKCFIIQFLKNYADRELSEDESKVFFLRYTAGMSNGEIADELGCGKKSVENACFRALSHLRKEAVEELNCMLWKKFGYRTAGEVFQDEAELEEDGNCFSGTVCAAAA